MVACQRNLQTDLRHQRDQRQEFVFALGCDSTYASSGALNKGSSPFGLGRVQVGVDLVWVGACQFPIRVVPRRTKPVFGHYIKFIPEPHSSSVLAVPVNMEHNPSEPTKAPAICILRHHDSRQGMSIIGSGDGACDGEHGEMVYYRQKS